MISNSYHCAVCNPCFPIYTTVQPLLFNTNTVLPLFRTNTSVWRFFFKTNRFATLYFKNIHRCDACLFIWRIWTAVRATLIFNIFICVTLVFYLDRCDSLYFEHIHLCDAFLFIWIAVLAFILNIYICVTLVCWFEPLCDACFLKRTAVRRTLVFCLTHSFRIKTNVSLVSPKQIDVFTHTSVYTNTHAYATNYLKQAGNVILINVYSTCVLDPIPLNDIQSKFGIHVA